MNYCSGSIFATVLLAASLTTLTESEVMPRITGPGATEAKLGQFPWEVRLITYQSNGKPVYCTGVLISDQWVLTAVQCITGKHAVVQLNTTVTTTCGNDVVKVITTGFYKHPNYTSTAQLVLNDIALLKLSYPVPHAANIKSIRLAKKDEVLKGGEKVVIPGWGQSKNPNNPTLMYGETQVITNEACKEFFYPENVVDGTVCTNGTTSPCYGDGGSGLVQYVNKEPVVVGVVSFVPKEKCFNGGPAGYMRVSYYRDWIDSIITTK